MITHQQVCERLRRMEETINEMLSQQKTNTFSVQALTAERDYWRNWAMNNGWATNAGVGIG